MTTKYEVEALVLESLCLLNNFQKTLFHTCSIQSNALQDKVVAGTSALQAGKKLQVFDPSALVSVRVFLVGITDWLPIHTLRFIL